MSARPLAIFAAVAVLAPALLAAPGHAGRGAEASGPSRLLVTADEWTLLLSRPKVRGGRALIELHNRGEDPHDLHLRRIGGKRVYEIDRVGPGAQGRIWAKLRRRSRYRLWCSLPDHRSRGMEAKLRVARKRR